MRILRVIGAATASLLCTAVVSAPALAAPSAGSTTAAAGSYKLGVYDYKLGAGCKSGTVTLSGWDSRITDAYFGVIKASDPASPNSYSFGEQKMTNGAATLTMRDGGGGVPGPGRYTYDLVIKADSVIVATYSGEIACGPAAPTAAAPTAAAPGLAETGVRA